MPTINGGPNGDDDNDGVRNLIEYYLVKGSDLTYIIETSETLSGSWSPAVTHGPAQLDLPISYSFTPAPDTPKNFTRLKVVMVP